MMKKVFCISLLLMILPVLIFGAEKFVTKSTLSVSDIQNYTQMKLSNSDNLSVLGIHQIGNEARVYYSYIYTDGAGRQKLSTSSFSIIRFNSGKWFDHGREKFITK